MSWTRRVKHPSKMVAVGDTVEAVVLDIDTANNRISLGMKQLESNPYEQLREKYPPGTVVKGKVRNIADFGIFVEIEEGIDGLVHISDMSWTQRVKHPSEMFQKGDEVEAAVLNIDTADGEKPKISLGIKQLIGDPWDRIPYEYPVGKVVPVKILKVLDFGAFVELERGVEGLVHVSEISDERIEDPRTVLKPGEETKAQIITVDPVERKIGLSIRSAANAGNMAEVQAAFVPGSTGGATLGDVMRAKLSGEGAGSQKKKSKGGGKKSRQEDDGE
jgi:small subunit ribosomal protein S1